MYSRATTWSIADLAVFFPLLDDDIFTVCSVAWRETVGWLVFVRIRGLVKVEKRTAKKKKGWGISYYMWDWLLVVSKNFVAACLSWVKRECKNQGFKVVGSQLGQKKKPGEKILVWEKRRAEILVEPITVREFSGDGADKEHFSVFR